MQKDAPSCRRPLGRTSLQVSALGLGGAPIGGRFGPVTAGPVRRVVSQFFEEGLNTLDTAASYSDGKAEALLGACLAGISRDAYIISTKIKPPPPDQPRRFEAIEQALQCSCERLATDQVDVLLLHDPYDLSPHELAQDLSAMVRLRESGDVRAVGVGIGDVNCLQFVVEYLDIDCILLSSGYTLLNQEAAQELLPLCLDRGVGVFLGSVFESGILATGITAGARYAYSRKVPAEVLSRVAKLEATCAKFQIPMAAAALQFAMANPAISTVLVGTTVAAHLREDCRLARIDIPEEFWSAIVRAGLIGMSARLPGSR